MIVFHSCDFISGLFFSEFILASQEGSVMGKLSNVTDLIKKQINISFNDYLDTCEARSFKLTRLSNLLRSLRLCPLDQLFTARNEVGARLCFYTCL